jgi:hypothetical protein
MTKPRNTNKEAKTYRFSGQLHTGCPGTKMNHNVEEWLIVARCW